MLEIPLPLYKPVIEALTAAAGADHCICGDVKRRVRPFCDRCTRELLARGLRSAYTAAHCEFMMSGLMWNYDICCDVLAAVYRGQFVLGRKKVVVDE